MPDPSAVRAWVVWPRWKRSNTRGRSASADATTRVAHLEHHPLALRASRTLTSPFSVNLNALLTRLRTIFSHMSRSTNTGSGSGAHSTTSAASRARTWSGTG